jgi:hypothetical protein
MAISPDQVHVMNRTVRQHDGNPFETTKGAGVSSFELHGSVTEPQGANPLLVMQTKRSEQNMAYLGLIRWLAQIGLYLSP